MSGNGRVVIGRVTRPHALAGGVRVKPDGSMIASLEVGDPLRVAIEGQEPRDLTLAHRSGTAAAPILRFREIESRDDAEGIRGGLLSVSEEMVPSDPDGHTFLVRDLIGCTVFSGNGRLARWSTCTPARQTTASR